MPKVYQSIAMACLPLRQAASGKQLGTERSLADLQNLLSEKVMLSQPRPNPKYQDASLKILKAVLIMPAQVLFYTSALLAVAATGGVALPTVLGTLATTVGTNVLATMLERVARGDNVPDDEIRKAVEDAISSSGIEGLLSSNEFQRAIGHLVRRFDILKYAVERGEINIANTLYQQFTQYTAMLEELQDGLDYVRERIDKLATFEQGEEIKQTLHQLTQQNVFFHSYFPTELVDQKINEEVSILRKIRFFIDFLNRTNSVLVLAKRLTSGDFYGGTPAVRSRALAWCARILSRSEEQDKAEECLEVAQSLESNIETQIARAFIYSQKGDKSAALSSLGGIDTPMSRSAAFMIIAHHEGPEEAIDWVKTTKINVHDLDPDGRYMFLLYLLQLERWEAARECVDTLTDEDLRQTPILHHMMAITRLLDAILDKKLRSSVLIRAPFYAASFPLASDAAGMAARRAAHFHFANAIHVEAELGCSEAAKLDTEYALWLELTDPEKSREGRQRLEANLRNPNAALHLVNLGLQFGIHLDLATVEQQIEREIALHGGITPDAAIARYALAHTKPPIEAASYIAKYSDELTKVFGKKHMLLFQIDVLLQARLLEKAKEYLDLLKNEGLSAAEEDDIWRRIAEAEGNDPIEARKEQFKKTNAIDDLANLVYELENRQDWESVCEYGRILFERTHDIRYAEHLVRALSHTEQNEQIVQFLETNREFLERSKPLRMQYCLSLYYEGELLKARSELAKLTDYQHDANYRALQVNIGITLGDWKSLVPIVANEAAEKDNRSAEELIAAAHLAFRSGSPHAKELTFAAAAKGSNDPNILVGAYNLATNAGWEDDPVVFKWLDDAAKLSDETGPIYRKTLKEVIEWKPEWERRASNTWNMLSHGEIPMFVAAQLLNMSLIDLTLFPALTNPSEIDPRRRGIVAAYSGAWQPKLLNVHSTVGIDASALLTLSLLNLLDKTFDAFDAFYVPHSTLRWLFDEKQKAAFHQPSQIREAHQLRDLLATGVVEKFVPSTVADSNLSDQIGDELALLISDAEKVREDDKTQRIVVQPSPVYYISSLMQEEADLTSHAAVLSSCQSVVDKLKQKGEITTEEEKKYRAYLQLHEKPWPNQPEIADNAILYFDAVALTHFLHLKILKRIKTAGYRLIASPAKVSEINTLISYDSISDTVNEVIERIRLAVSSRIQSGKIRVGRENNKSGLEDKPISEHPTLGVFTLANTCDAIIIDDRSFNQHSNIDGGAAQSQVFSTLDLIDTLTSIKAISPDERLEYRTTLRRAGYLFIPIDGEELRRHLNNSPIQDSKVVETAELKAIRESFLRVRMTDWLQLPREEPWLDMSLQSFIQALTGLWKAGTDFSIAWSRSDWIIDQIEVRGWAHRLGTADGDNFIKSGRGMHILHLLRPPIHVSPDVMNEYWRWAEDRILGPIKEQDPDLYTWLVDWQRKHIAEIIRMGEDQGTEDAK